MRQYVLRTKFLILYNRVPYQITVGMNDIRFSSSDLNPVACAWFQFEREVSHAARGRLVSATKLLTVKLGHFLFIFSYLFSWGAIHTHRFVLLMLLRAATSRNQNVRAEGGKDGLGKALLKPGTILSKLGWWHRQPTRNMEHTDLSQKGAKDAVRPTQRIVA